MAFDSPGFLFVLGPTFFLVYFAAPAGSRNFVCLATSLAFYAWAEPVFSIIALASAIIDYWLVRGLTLASGERVRMTLATVAVMQVLLAFALFRYASTFGGMAIARASSGALTYASPLWPAVMALMALERVTYIVGAYRGRTQTVAGLIDYLTYVFLFPKLFAGPIVNYRDMASWLARNRLHGAAFWESLMQRIRDAAEWVRFLFAPFGKPAHSARPPHGFALASGEPRLQGAFLEGLWLFGRGMAKKVLLADGLAVGAGTAFGTAPQALGAGDAWLGLACLSFQIYFEFSGFSDMAVGLARMLGLPLRGNFDQPYLARNFTDFWRRWHISLTAWIREYVYIPLGGNRHSSARAFLNLVTCILFCALWHASGIMALAWGLYHGLFLIADRLVLRALTSRLPGCVNVALTFPMIAGGWILLRAPDMQYATAYVAAMFDGHRDTAPVVLLDQNLAILLGVAMAVSFTPRSWFDAQKWPRPVAAIWSAVATAIVLFGFIWSCGRVAGQATEPRLQPQVLDCKSCRPKPERPS